MMVIRGHVVVGEVSICWILRSVSGGAAGHGWRNFSVWALIYTGDCCFFFKKLQVLIAFFKESGSKLQFPQC